MFGKPRRAGRVLIWLWAVGAASGPLCAASLRLPDEQIQQRFGALLQSAHGDPEALNAALDAEILAFQSLIEEGFVFRQQMAATALDLKARSASDRPLSGADLDRFQQGVGRGLEIARRILAATDTHSLWRTADSATFRAAGFADPLPLPLRTKGTMLALAGSLFLYDTYRLEITMLAENDRLRRLLNGGDKGYENSRNVLNEMTQEYLSVPKREGTAAELRYCEENQFATAAYYGGQGTIRWLQQLIAQSPSREILRQGLLPAPEALTEQAVVRLGQLFGGVRDLGEDSMNTVSLCFGNTVGLVEFRKGRLWNDASVAARVKATLRPGDILLEKTPFRLTDTFIPGHWGHVAVWIGTEAELKELGLWDDPVVRPHQEAIRAGRSVVEALRPGVQLNTVEHFLNIDDLAVLQRNPALDAATLRHQIRLALRQVGKEYDFNFDVETTDKIVCSELVYVVCTDLEWPTDKTLGRYTISPDNVARRALEGGPLRLALFYHEGAPVEERSTECMAELIRRADPAGFSSALRLPLKSLGALVP